MHLISFSCVINCSWHFISFNLTKKKSNQLHSIQKVSFHLFSFLSSFELWHFNHMFLQHTLKTLPYHFLATVHFVAFAFVVVLFMLQSSLFSSFVCVCAAGISMSSVVVVVCFDSTNFGSAIFLSSDSFVVVRCVHTDGCCTCCCCCCVWVCSISPHLSLRIHAAVPMLSCHYQLSVCVHVHSLGILRIRFSMRSISIIICAHLI